MTGRRSRRRVLAALGGGVCSTAGCLDGLGQRDGTGPDDAAGASPTDGPGEGTESADGAIGLADGWASFGADAANTGHLETAGPLDPAVAWEFETTSAIYDGAAAVGDRVFVGSTDGNLYAVEAETGEEAWRFPPKGQVRTIPAVADGTVYVTGRRGGLEALEFASGTHRWSALDDERLSDPVLDDGTVFLGAREGTLFAVDAATGHVRWRFELDGNGLTGVAVDDDAVYAGWYGETHAPGESDDDGVVAVTRDGEERWRLTAADVDAAPTVVGDVVYLCVDAEVAALDATDGEELWRFEGDASFASPAVADGTVYAASSDTNVYALDAATGEERWRFDPVNRMSYAPAVADELVYVAGWTGRVSGLDPDDGEKRWAVQLETPLSDPAVLDGTVYVATENTLVALRDD